MAKQSQESEKEGEQFNLDEINPFHLFCPRPGTTDTSLVRECYGLEETKRVAMRLDAVAIVEFEVAKALTVLDQDTGVSALSFEATPNEDSVAHASMYVNKYPQPLQKKGERMSNDVKAELATLYERLYECRCQDPPRILEQVA